MIETTDCHQKQDDLYIVKSVYPFLSLRPLSPHVKHAICEVSSLEKGLGDASGPESGAQNVLIIWNICLGK